MNEEGYGDETDGNFEILIGNIAGILQQHNLVGEFVISTVGDGMLHINDVRLREIVMRSNLHELGITHPSLPTQYSITIVRDAQGEFVVEINAGPDSQAERIRRDTLEQAVIMAVRATLQNTTITFHPDGNITGTGMGHHIAKSLRQLQPGDMEELQAVLKDPVMAEKLRLVLTNVQWQAVDDQRTPTSITIH